MKNLSHIIIAMLICCTTLTARAAVTASLDRDQVESGESVQLTLQHDGRTDTQPDVAPLKRDFDVLGSSSGSSFQFVNGHMSAQVQVTLTLSPKHDGKLRIPPLQWGGDQSPELEVTVGGGAASSQSDRTVTANASHVFLITTLEPKQPYVQSTAVLTVRLYFDQQLYQAGLELQGSNDVLIQQLGKDVQGSETRNGRRYDVVERKYLLQPQRSGQITLDGPVLEAQIADTSRSDRFGSDPFFGRTPLAGMFNSTRPLRLHGDAILLNVRPRPAAWTGGDWLPAQKLTLEESWRPDNAIIHAGEPLTRHLHLSADGLTGAQLPDLSALMRLPEGVKAYPDQAKLDTQERGDKLVGSRDQDIALIASNPGHYELPALRLAWWDTVQDVQREVVLPARTLDVLPAVGGSSAAAPAVANPAPEPVTAATAEAKAPVVSAESPSTRNLPWLWISLALGLLWLGTLVAWWWSRRRASKVIMKSVAAATDLNTELRAGSALKAFRQACRDNDPNMARQNLLLWARATWPQDVPVGLNALSQRLSDPRLTTLLRELDRACYADGVWKGESLAQMLKVLPTQAKKASNASELGELYPF